ncbi:MAG: tyrosine-type recombinase/integrase, partial [Gemmatimonadales bacterium]
HVDLKGGTVRLDPDETKNRKPRVFPFAALPALATLIKRQRAYTAAVERRTGRIVPWVFHAEGEPIGEFHKTWRRAVERAAYAERDGLRVVLRPQLVGRLVHDLRRTAARNFTRGGVSQHVVMQLCGWETDSMFRRYAIVDERDLGEAVAKLAAFRRGRGTLGAHSGGAR